MRIRKQTFIQHFDIYNALCLAFVLNFTILGVLECPFHSGEQASGPWREWALE